MLGKLELELRSRRSVGGKQPQREPGQLRGGFRGAAHARVAGGRSELPHDRGVRPGRSECEMPRSLLRVAGEVGDSAVRLAEPGRRSGGVDRRREERMDELDPPVRLDAHEPSALDDWDRVMQTRYRPFCGDHF